MDDALLVRGLERSRDLKRELNRFFNRDRTPLQPIGQCLAFDKFEDQEACAVGFFEP